MTDLSLTINGRKVAAATEPRTALADFVRDTLDLTGTHLGCEHGVCGACTLLVDGVPARSCITAAVSCADAEVTTIEGLDADEITTELRAAFTREHALQCGYCTPGMLVSARDLVVRLEEPCERRIRIGMSGNLCRCTGYVGIVRAVQAVIADRRARGIPAQPDGGRKVLGPAGAHTPAAGRAESVPLAARTEASAPAPAMHLDADADFTPKDRFEQRFTVAFPPERVFAFLGDVGQVAACLPGAALTAPPADDRVEGEMRVKIGPIGATFRGTAQITRDPAQRSGHISGGGIDAGGRSSARGVVGYRVLPGEAEGTSLVTVEVGYTLSGILAQFGRPGLVRDVAGRLTADFARNLEARLSGAAPAERPKASELDAASLALGLLRDWLGALWRKIAGR